MKQLSSDETPVSEYAGWPRNRIRMIALGLFAAVGIYLCYRLAHPCIPSLVWAGALALVFTPLHRWFEARLRRPSLAAALSLVVIGLLVVVPATWFAQKLAEQATSVPENIQKQIAAGKWHINPGQHPLMARLLARIEKQISSPEDASLASTWLRTIVSRLIKESAVAVVQVSLTLYFLFYFLRDRLRVLKAIRSFLPLSENDTETLFSRINDTIHATLYGMLALSALQGLLGGLMFWWLGVPSPWFWALVAAVFAFVPVVDTFVLWLPAAVYLGLEGRWGEALGVAALGSLVVRGIENFLYPVLVKDRLRVPSVSIFVSLVGGLLLFGWSGLVLGPVILTITSALVEMCVKRFSEPQGPPGPDPNKSTDAEQTWAAVPDLPLNPCKLLKPQMPQERKSRF
ncbi:MAG TPA: AI-2E family transporter [Candidatus Limnocylindrales bacterium]|nr:AI-2E family transporter [Candidatus Limnocylindrales bacterium]